uniref:Si:ch211-214j8.12 n=1 Tax=Neogobius melanostomus TaxID=47308 RepID=A0A8C6US23_9GOBI
MPLYGASKGDHRKEKSRQKEAPGWMSSRSITDDEDGCPLSLTRLCLLSLAENINTTWTKDYSDKYLDQYLFRHIMGPFNVLCAELVEELISLLCIRKKLSRAALDLLLVPQLRALSLASCPGLATTAVCAQISARCRLLSNLDISGAQQLSSKVLLQTLPSLHKLRSLSLATTTTDKSVIQAVVQNCTILCHLDISQCHLVSPTDLLLLGGSSLYPSSHTSGPSSNVCTASSLPLNSLLALDIGFEEQKGDAVAVAAYLLLTLSGLEKFAIEGIAQACKLILHNDFQQTDLFSAKEEILTLEEVWKQSKYRQSSNFSCKTEDDYNEPKTCHNKRQDNFTLRLKEVRILSCESLSSLGRLCPGITTIFINADYPETAEVVDLTKALENIPGQLKSLSLQYSDLLQNISDTVCVVGSSLLSLTLEGVKTSPSSYSSLLRILQACPRLKELSISLQPFQLSFAVEYPNNRLIDWNRLHLPDLRSLTLRFSYEHSQIKPYITECLFLKTILGCLLVHSALLQKICLISLPCPLNCILEEVLQQSNMNQSESLPLRCLQHLDLQRTDVKMRTLENVIFQCKRLKFVDVSYCWNISCSEMDSVRAGRPKHNDIGTINDSQMALMQLYLNSFIY